MGNSTIFSRTRPANFNADRPSTSTMAPLPVS